MNMKFTGHVKTAARSSHTKNRVCRGCSAPYRTFKCSPHTPCHGYLWNSVATCISPRPTKKPLGPIPQNPPEVKYFNFNSWLFSIFASYLNELLPGELSLGLQIFVVCSEDGTWEKLCYLRLYVKGRGRGVLSKSAIINNVVFFDVLFERTPPTAFVRSASKFFSKLTRCHLSKVVLFATLRQRARPWRTVKVGHFEFIRIIFKCLFFPMFGNQLLLRHLSVRLQHLSVQSEDGA